METQLEGTVRASRYDPACQGKQFLGAAIECGDGRVWVVDYEEQSPFHAFAGRQVVAFGEACEPEPEEQFLTGWDDGRKLGHFRVTSIRPAEVTPGLGLVEVGPAHRVRGRFEGGTSDAGESILSFVTEQGDTFLLANDPAGAAPGRNVEAWAYPVQLSPSKRKPPGQYRWIICPCSAADLWEWRGRSPRRLAAEPER